MDRNERGVNGGKYTGTRGSEAHASSLPRISYYARIAHNSNGRNDFIATGEKKTIANSSQVSHSFTCTTFAPMYCIRYTSLHVCVYKLVIFPLLKVRAPISNVYRRISNSDSSLSSFSVPLSHFFPIFVFFFSPCFGFHPLSQKQFFALARWPMISRWC